MSRPLGAVRTVDTDIPVAAGRLAARAYLPAWCDDPHDAELPRAVVLGSWTTVKEQMAGTYAAGLAARGIVAWTFDFTGWGASDGALRDAELPVVKVNDLRAVIGWVHARAGGAPVGLLGICAGAGYAALAAAGDPAVDVVALVAPWLHDPVLVAEIYGGADAVAAKISESQAAWAAYRSTGAVAYVPGASADDPTAAMYGPFDYYLDQHRGAVPQWANRLATLSWQPWLTFDPHPAAPHIHAPTLMIHSEAAAVPAGAHQFYEALTCSKQIIWTSGSQFDFYDDPATVRAALDRTTEHLLGVLYQEADV